MYEFTWVLESIVIAHYVCTYVWEVWKRETGSEPGCAIRLGGQWLVVSGQWSVVSSQ